VFAHLGPLVGRVGRGEMFREMAARRKPRTGRPGRST
jgi:hypothetical protein